MSRVVTTEIEKGDLGAITDPNATLTSWTSASTDVDEVNIAQEGIEQRNLAVNAVNDNNSSPGTKVIANSGSGTIAAAVATPWQIGGVFLQIGPFAYDSAAPEELIVRFSFEYELEPLDLASFYIYRSTTGAQGIGAFSLIAKTARSVGAGGAVDIDDYTGSTCIAARETAAIASGNIWYCLYAVSNTASNLTIRNVDAYTERIKR